MTKPCCDKIILDDIKDPIVRKEILDIQSKIDIAIATHKNSTKVDDTYMTDMNYSGSASDLEEKLRKEIEDRTTADAIISSQLNQEISDRINGDLQALADVRLLINTEKAEREAADNSLSERIDHISGSIIGSVEEQIEAALKPVREKIDNLYVLFEELKTICSDAWEREQARAMAVEENLQKQIYELKTDYSKFVRKDQPIDFTTVLLPENPLLDN